MQMDKSIFFPFSPLFDVPFFSPFILLPVFFGFEVLLFDFPCVFLFFAFFSSLKNIRISYRGGHKTNIAIENHHAINGKTHYFYGHFQ